MATNYNILTQGFLGNRLVWAQYFAGSTSLNTIGGIYLSAATDKIAYKFFLSKNCILSGWTHSTNPNGTQTGITTKCHFETHDPVNNLPSGVQIGQTSNPVTYFSLLTGYAPTGLNVTLSANQFYWLVVEDGGGVPPTNTNWYQPRQMSGNAGNIAAAAVRKYDGATSTWLTNSVTNNDGSFSFITTNNEIMGGLMPNATMSNVSNFFGANRWGIKFRFKGKPIITGFSVRTGRSNNPTSNVEGCFYKGSTLLETVTLTGAQFGSINSGPGTVNFNLSAGYQIIPNTDYYFYLHNVNDGGDASNRYLISYSNSYSAFAPSYLPSYVLPISGTTADPTTLAVFGDVGGPLGINGGSGGYPSDVYTCPVISIFPLIGDPMTGYVADPTVSF